MKVETDFAPGDHAFAAMDQRARFLFSFVVVKASVVRMRADGRVNSLVRLAELDRALERATVRIACANVQDRRDTRRMRTLDDLLAIRIKLRTVNVRMRVDKHSINFEIRITKFEFSITSSARRSARLQ